jgi:hypothetical protein
VSGQHHVPAALYPAKINQKQTKISQSLRPLRKVVYSAELCNYRGAPAAWTAVSTQKFDFGGGGAFVSTSEFLILYVLLIQTKPDIEIFGPAVRTKWAIMLIWKLKISM